MFSEKGVVGCPAQGSDVQDGLGVRWWWLLGTHCLAVVKKQVRLAGDTQREEDQDCMLTVPSLPLMQRVLNAWLTGRGVSQDTFFHRDIGSHAQ